MRGSHLDRVHLQWNFSPRSPKFRAELLGEQAWKSTESKKLEKTSEITESNLEPSKTMAPGRLERPLPRGRESIPLAVVRLSVMGTTPSFSLLLLSLPFGEGQSGLWALWQSISHGSRLLLQAQIVSSFPGTSTAPEWHPQDNALAGSGADPGCGSRGGDGDEGARRHQGG